MTYVPIRLRNVVEERASERCEYCLAQKSIVMFLEIDHVIPTAAGGETEMENLCLACRGCNGFKFAFVSGVDPETEEETPLFHPRMDRWAEHFRWANAGTRIIGLTAIGRATVDRLRMNRPDVVDARKIWVEAGWHPPPIGDSG